jgi:MFS family permease
MLGLVALFTDMATEMAMPLLPAFLASIGSGAFALGLVEGAADFTSAALKFFSGRISDVSGRRRPWVLGGYVLSSLARPFLALATQSWHVVAVRVTDRTGKGLRSSARDAMLADSVPPSSHGAAFGFHQSLDHLGAVLGPLIAVALLALAGLSLRSIFWLTAIPGAIAVAFIILGVQEVESTVPVGAGQRPARPSASLIRFLIPLAVFGLGASSDLFLLLKAQQSDMPVYTLPLLWVALHVVKSSSSIPGGRLSDRIGPLPTITLGWLYYALIYTGFAFSSGPKQFMALFIAYGLFYGLTEAPEKALVSRLAPKDQRGAAFGWYNLVAGLAALPASLLFGLLWQGMGQQAAFLFGAGVSLLGIALLWTLNASLAEA